MRVIRHILAVLTCISFFTSGFAIQTRKHPVLPLLDYATTTDRDNPALWESDPLPLTKAAAPGAYSKRNVPRTGSREYLTVLVDFTDTHFFMKDTAELRNYYDRMFNEKDFSPNIPSKYKSLVLHPAQGCVADYFQDQSFGKFKPSFRIVGPIHASQGFAYYGKNSGGDDRYVNRLVSEIIDSISAQGEIDLTQYSINGAIENLCVIYAGNGENYDYADANRIFPHADSIQNVNGLKRVFFCCSCELFWDSDSIIDGIGTICHEFAHTLGLPDFYNKSSASSAITDAAMGYWSLMDYGNYENEGFSPVGLTAFEKYSLGWMDIEEIKAPGHYTLSADISQEPDPENEIHSAYRINTEQENSFIILENHAKTGWYKYHASEGLLVTGVRYDRSSWSSNQVNTTSSNLYKRFHIFPADNDYNRSSNAGDLFPYQDVDSITTKGQPALLIASYTPQYSVYDIRKEGNIIAFNAGQDRTSAGIDNRSAKDISINVTDGELSVTAPLGTEVTVHDISGRMVSKTITTQATQRIALPGRGVWIVKCGKTVRKLRIEN